MADSGPPAARVAADQLRHRYGERGQALISALLTTSVLLPLATFALMQARLDGLVMQRTREAAQSLATADAGLEHALSELARDPRFDRLPLGPDGRAGTADDGDFPFASPPPAAFPGAPYHYAVRVDRIDADHCEVEARGFGPFGAARAVAAAVRRLPLPYIVGALASAAAMPDLQLGDAWRIEGAASDATHGDVPAVAGCGDDVAAALRAALPGSAAGRLVGPGGSPSVGAATVPSAATLLDAARTRDDQQALSGVISGALGNGLFVSRAPLRLRDVAGGGVLLVDGPLELAGNVHFAGLIVVNGDLHVDDGAAVEILGGVLQGAAGSVLALRGSGLVRYDAPTFAALATAYPSLLPRAAQVTGWRELPEVGP